MIIARSLQIEPMTASSKEEHPIVRFWILVVSGAVAGGLPYLFILDDAEPRPFWAFASALFATAFFAIWTDAGRRSVKQQASYSPRFIVSPFWTPWRRVAGWAFSVLFIALLFLVHWLEGRVLLDLLIYLCVGLGASYFVFGHFETRIPGVDRNDGEFH
jgi:hypothetical protein